LEKKSQMKKRKKKYQKAQNKKNRKRRFRSPQEIVMHLQRQRLEKEIIRLEKEIALREKRRAEQVREAEDRYLYHVMRLRDEKWDTSSRKLVRTRHQPSQRAAAV